MFLAFSRLGFIIYTKESSRRKPDSDSLEPAYAASKGPGAAAAAAAAVDQDSARGSGTPPSDGDAGGNGDGGFMTTKGWGRSSDRGAGTGPVMWSAKTGAVATPAGAAGNGPAPAGAAAGPDAETTATAVLQSRKYRDLFGTRRELSSSRRLSSSSFQEEESPTTANTKANAAVSQKTQSRRAILGQNGTAAAALSGTHPSPAFRSTAGRAGAPISRSNSTAQPAVSPVGRAVAPASANAVSADGSLPHQTPRAKSGLEVQKSGSLWDRSTVSPIIPRQVAAAAAAAPSTPKVTPPVDASTFAQKSTTELPPPRRRGSSSTSIGGRDQFEDALLRALDDKWESGRSAAGAPGNGSAGAGAAGGGAQMMLPPQRTISRSESYAEAPNSMLKAVKTWTCQCAFENSVGQTACLGCGRVAPLSRPTTPARRRLPPHRSHSRIAVPSEDDL